MIYFVTGTDTDSGKTFVSAALLAKAKQEGRTTLGIKPIASGCEWVDGRLSNADARALIEHSSIQLGYAQHNPFSFEPAIAPHIAAQEAGVDLTLQAIEANLPYANMQQAKFCLVEGAGGWRLPINSNEYLPTLVKKQRWPVIVVVGMKLGCLNHALLTIEAIKADSLEIAGWVANRAEADMARFDENLSHLRQSIDAPYLGCLPHLENATAAEAANYLNLPN